MVDKPLDAIGNNCFQLILVFPPTRQVPRQRQDDPESMNAGSRVPNSLE